MAALVLGDGPTYHSNSRLPLHRFDGLKVCCHYYRQRADVVISVDPRDFVRKEGRALGKARVVIGLSAWANRLRLRDRIPKRDQKRVEFTWCHHPKLTSGLYAIEWCVQQGYKEIYTMGVDLPRGYHRVMDQPDSRALLSRTLESYRKRGVAVYKMSKKSTLPVSVKSPPLPDATPKAKPSASMTFAPPETRDSTTRPPQASRPPPSKPRPSLELLKRVVEARGATSGAREATAEQSAPTSAPSSAPQSASSAAAQSAANNVRRELLLTRLRCRR
jgi:hypothetical protein